MSRFCLLTLLVIAASGFQTFPAIQENYERPISIIPLGQTIAGQLPQKSLRP